MSNIFKDILVNLNHSINVQIDKEKMSPIDSIKILNDVLNNNNINEIVNLNIKKNKFISDNEKYILDILTSEKFIIAALLSENHTRNLLHDIYFIISNKFMLKLKIFEIIYKDRHLINLIPDITNKILYIITNSRLKKFYNRFMIKRWIDCLDYTRLEKSDIDEDRYNLYLDVWSIFKLNVNKVKQGLFDILIRYESLNHIPGCSNLSVSDYKFIVKTHIGLDLTSKDFALIVKFARKELNILLSEFNEIIDKLKPEYVGLDYNEKLKKLEIDPDLKCKSVEEYIQLHREYIEKSNDTFINKYKFPQYSKPKLLAFSDKNRGHAYWAFDTFYLNTVNWKESNKYQILALVLHETIPGHHLHLNYSIHDKNNSHENIICNLFNIGINGFSEGLGLYAENLYENFSDWEKLGQIQYDIFRTTRLIVDIGIHIGGESIDSMVNFMSRYVEMPKESIKVEIYRYFAMPGQALSYKIGCEIIKKIVQKKNKNLLAPESIQEFKNILLSKEQPLQFLLNKYNLTFAEIF
jgi:hypothetical protein